MNIIFAGWRNDGRWDQGWIRKAFSKFLSLYPHWNMNDFHCWSDASGRFILASLQMPAEQLGPRQYFVSSQSSVATYTGFPIILGSEEPGRVILEADEIAAHYGELEAYGEGRFAGFWVDDTGLHVLTDPFGMQHVFQVHSENIAVWSTSLWLIRDILSLQHDQPNSQAVAEYVAKEYLGSGITLLNTPSRLFGGRHVHVNCQGHLDTRHYYNFPVACMSRRGHALDSEKLLDGFLQLGRGLGKVHLPYRAGITGGHDSRLVAALMHRARVPLDLFSSGEPGNPDYDIGRELAIYFGLPWSSEETMEGDATKTHQDWESIFAKLIRSADGHCSLLFASNTPLSYPDQNNLLPVTILGSGGETARSHYVTKNELFGVMPGQNVVDRFVERHLCGADALLTSEGRELAHEGTRKRLAAYIEEGLRDHEILATYYAEDRMAGWGGGALRMWDINGDPFCPLITRAFQEVAVSLSPLQQLQEILHYRLTQMVDPQLLKIPFQTPYPSQNRFAYILKTVVDYSHDRLLRQFNCGSTSDSRTSNPYRITALEINRKRWFQPLLEDNKSSNIWQVVERDNLDRLINDDSLIESRRSHCTNLYGLLTCWAFFHYQYQPVHYS